MSFTGMKGRPNTRNPFVASNERESSVSVSHWKLEGQVSAGAHRVCARARQAAEMAEGMIFSPASDAFQYQVPGSRISAKIRPCALVNPTCKAAPPGVQNQPFECGTILE